MSWLQSLYETYEICVQNEDLSAPTSNEDGTESPGLLPMSHITQQAHICISIDHEGNFIRAELLPLKVSYVVPATEDSASRSGRKPPPHPLSDKVRYCAKDYVGEQENFFAEYIALLGAWCQSEHAHPKAQAVYNYVSRGTVVHDLVDAGILFVDEEKALLTKAPEGVQNSIFKHLTAKSKTKRFDQGDAFVLWRVIIPHDKEECTWKDAALQKAWGLYDNEQMQNKALCMLAGTESSVTTKHPCYIRRPGDKAKIISSNDDDGFTFRGRLVSPSEVCSLGYEASNKAHSALRWLIGRQGYRNQDQAIVAWASSGVPLPQPCAQWFDPCDDDFSIPDDDISVAELDFETGVAHADVGQAFARRLGKAMLGYRSDLQNAQGISILAVDSASPGRLSVIFHRSQLPEEYLRKLQAWQEDFAWILPWKVHRQGQENGQKDKTLYTAFAPTPKDIARVAYGQRIDEKLLKASIERLLPCIVDGAPMPRDIVENCLRRACQRIALEAWEWPLVLGTACGLYKGYYARHPQLSERRVYTMSLDEERSTRDYLYGRLLAVAEYLERRALGDEKRPTNAERLLTRFADRPCSTWRTLEIQLNPYLRRLQSNERSMGTFVFGKGLLQHICNMFTPDDFTNDAKLSGEFLLAYHCQLSALYAPRKTEEIANTEGESHE